MEFVKSQNSNQTYFDEPMMNVSQRKYRVEEWDRNVSSKYGQTGCPG